MTVVHQNNKAGCHGTVIVIPSLRKLQKEDCEFKASLGSQTKTRSKNKANSHLTQESLELSFLPLSEEWVKGQGDCVKLNKYVWLSCGRTGHKVT